MENKLDYSDHIAHYITDAEVSDYFNLTNIDQQFIRRRYQYFKFLLSLKKDDTFCEIGSGGGEGLSIINKNVKYFPIDLSLKNLRIIHEKSGNSVSPVMADAYTLPFKNAAFTKLIISEVLEHLQNPELALKEIYRILKPGGRAIISVPYREKISYHLCIHCNKLTPANAHLHSFNEINLSLLAKDAGFKIKRIISYGNKLGQLLRLNVILQMFPFFVWHFFEMLLNLFIPKKSLLMCVISKDK